MKCPWQWRQPFLDEKWNSRKRKVADGVFYDPVDPSFVDHLLPAHTKKFCVNPLESEEKESIAKEIERLMKKKHHEEEKGGGEDEEKPAETDGAGESGCSPLCHAKDESSGETIAIVNSILRLTKMKAEGGEVDAVDSTVLDEAVEHSRADDTDEFCESTRPKRCDSLHLVSDNLQHDFFTSDDTDLISLDGDDSSVQ